MLHGKRPVVFNSPQNWILVLVFRTKIKILKNYYFQIKDLMYKLFTQTKVLVLKCLLSLPTI
jgi:hypothetical protein